MNKAYDYDFFEKYLKKYLDVQTNERFVKLSKEDCDLFGYIKEQIYTGIDWNKEESKHSQEDYEADSLAFFVSLNLIKYDEEKNAVIDVIKLKQLYEKYLVVNEDNSLKEDKGLSFVHKRQS